MQENYTFGTQFVAINLAYVMGTPAAAYVYLPVFYRLQSASAYEYLEKRFGKATRLAASVAFSMQVSSAYVVDHNSPGNIVLLLLLVQHEPL